MRSNVNSNQQQNQPKPYRLRIISPHLMIYRPQLTSVLSISHRASGIAFLICLWLLAISSALALLLPQLWQEIHAVLPTWLVALVVVGLIASSVYHLLNGIRHLCWDYLLGLEIDQVYFSGKLMLVLFVLLVIAVGWLFLTG